MIWKVGVCTLFGKWVFVTGRKKKKYSIIGKNDRSKIRTHTVSNSLSGECSFTKKYCKTPSKKDDA